ncbi:FAD/NAD(P)-binding domain-containing protein [Mycena filopes]|nr:FAD/NAD(P)-binding domain-containing protein [Mycena filopes]
MASAITHIPLKVSIVGAGIAGLTAAIALRRNGHQVEIFEAADVIEEVGAAIVVPLNAQLVLQSLGYSKANLNSVDFLGVAGLKETPASRSLQPWIGSDSRDNQNILAHRSDLHVELQRLATGPGEGPPAIIHTSSKVIECEPEQSSITLSDGRIISSDLILGADGVASRVRTSILGRVEKSVPSGLTIYRGLVGMDKFEGRTDMSWLQDGISGPRLITRRDRSGAFRLLFLYPCRGGTLLNIVAIFKDSKQNEPGTCLPTCTSRSNVLDTFSDFHPKFLAVIEALDERVMKWQLRKVPVLPTWIRGHAAILGDAAHGTLPTMAQGSAMAIEDAGALGVLFPAGTTRSDVPARLAGYEALRKERGDFICRESLEQGTVPQKFGELFRSKEMQEKVLGFDALKAAQDYFKQHFERN